MRRRLPLLIGFATIFLFAHGLVSIVAGEPVPAALDLVFMALGIERFIHLHRST